MRSSAPPAAWLLACALLGPGFPPGTRVLCVSADRHVSVESGAERCVAAGALAHEPGAAEDLRSPVTDDCNPCSDIPLGGDEARLAPVKHPRADSAPSRVAGAGPSCRAPVIHALAAGPRLEAGVPADPAPPPIRSVRLRL